MGSFSIWHWLIVLLVVVLIFGTKKLRNMGSDVGGAVKNFKEAMNEGAQAEEVPLNTIKNESSAHLIDVAVVNEPLVEVPAPKAAPRKRAPAKPKAEAKPSTDKAPAAKPVTAKVATAKATTPRKAVAKKASS